MQIPGRMRKLLPLVVIVASVYGGVSLLQSHQAAVQGQVLRGLVKPGDLLMLSSTTCVYCTRARSWMTEQQVPFRECMIETDAACRAEFQARGGQGTPTFVVKGRTLVGFDPVRFAEILSRSRPAAPG